MSILFTSIVLFPLVLIRTHWIDRKVLHSKGTSFIDMLKDIELLIAIYFFSFVLSAVGYVALELLETLVALFTTRL